MPEADFVAAVEHTRERIVSGAAKIIESEPVNDEIEHVKLHAKQISDRALLADASEFQMKAERQLGIVIAGAAPELRKSQVLQDLH